MRFQPRMKRRFVAVTVDLFEDTDQLALWRINLIPQMKAKVQEHQQRRGVVLADERLTLDDGINLRCGLVEWRDVAVIAKKELIGECQNVVEGVTRTHPESPAIPLYEQGVHVENQVFGHAKVPHVIRALRVCEMPCRIRQRLGWPSRRTWQPGACGAVLRGR